MIKEPICDDFGMIFRQSDGETIHDLDIDEVKEYGRTKGAVVFHGFHLDVPTFEQFTDRLCHDWQTYQGGAHEKKVLNPDGDKTILSTNFYLGNKQQLAFELSLHSDMSYMKNKPSNIFFYCVMPAREGGETMLCDGAAVLRAFRPSTREFFQQKRIKYIRKARPIARKVRFWTEDLEEAKAFCAANDMTLTVDDKNDVWITEYTVSAIQKSQFGNLDVFCNSILPVLDQEAQGSDVSIVRMEDNSRIPEDIVAEIKDVTERLTYLIHWTAPGDAAICDNTRMLHGRRNFEDLEREVAQRLARSVPW